MRPYVQVTWGSQTRSTRPVEVPISTSKAHWGEGILFQLQGDMQASRLDQQELQVSILDMRNMQSVLRGDPKIASGTLRLSQEALGESKTEIVQLLAVSGGHVSLAVRVGVLAPRSSYAVLA